MIEIREADKDDYSIISYILNETWKVAYKGLIPESDMIIYTDKERREQMISEALEKGELKFYIAKYDNVECGVASFQKYDGDDYDNCAYIKQLYILPDYQKMGIGKSLMQHLYTIIKNLGYKRVILNTLEENSNARAFYEKLGFEYFGPEDSPLFSERVVRALYRKEII